jgi:hypothetical protein
MNSKLMLLCGLCAVVLFVGCNKPGTSSAEKKAPPTPPAAAPANTTDSK